MTCSKFSISLAFKNGNNHKNKRQKLTTGLTHDAKQYTRNIDMQYEQALTSDFFSNIVKPRKLL
jgi:hypothetical protein